MGSRGRSVIVAPLQMNVEVHSSMQDANEVHPRVSDAVEQNMRAYRILAIIDSNLIAWPAQSWILCDSLDR